MNNSISIQVNTIGEEGVVIDSIKFINTIYFSVYVDRSDLLQLNEFEGSLFVWAEFVKSAEDTGEFLLFTGANGIADAYGWQFVDVTHKEGNIEWFYNDGDRSFNFVFNKSQYLKEIENVIEMVNLYKGSKYICEPEVIIFPEN
jgi:hypothetical protein